jgi:hypothetical protein
MVEAKVVPEKVFIERGWTAILCTEEIDVNAAIKAPVSVRYFN